MECVVQSDNRRSSAALTWCTGDMTPAPFARLEAGAPRTAGVVVERRQAVVFYMCVKVVEALL